MNKKIPFFAILLFLVFNLNAQEIYSPLERYIDWTKKISFFKFRQALDLEDSNRLSAVSRADSRISSSLFNQLPTLFENILIDSRTRLLEKFDQDPEFLPELGKIIQENTKKLSSPSKDLKNLDIFLYTDLESLYKALLKNQVYKTDLEKVFSWQPSKEYSGIIIYATEKLDWFGTDEKAYCLPSLLPRIHDSKGRQIFDYTNMEPAFAAHWGTAAYASSVEEARQSDRVGTNPLILPARQVFGVYPSDPVLSVEDANLLLFNKSTRKALEEGRVIIVLSQSLISYD